VLLHSFDWSAWKAKQRALDLTVPRRASVRQRIEWMLGEKPASIEEAGKYNTALIGGDIKERKEQSIGCVGVGLVEKGMAIRRDGAKPGHIVAITLAGMPGSRQDRLDIRKIGCRWAQEIIEYRKLAEIEPYKRLYDKNWKRDLLFLSHKEMIAGAQTGLIKSAIDTSDGFLACLEILGRESKVGFILEETLIEEIIDEKVKEIAEALGLKPAQFLFNAGHDWEIVLTVQEDHFQSLRETFQEAGGDLARLGTVCNITDLIDPNEKADPRATTLPPKPLKKGIALISNETSKKLYIPYYTDEKFVRRAYEERPMDWEDLKFWIESWSSRIFKRSESDPISKAINSSKDFFLTRTITSEMDAVAGNSNRSRRLLIST